MSLLLGSVPVSLVELGLIMANRSALTINAEVGEPSSDGVEERPSR